MKILVMKFGGTSVADPARINKVAEIVLAAQAQGFRPVVVVSAMGDTTDDLIAMAKQCQARPDARELDLLLATGEQVSANLLSMSILQKDGRAQSFNATKAGIITTKTHGSAKVVQVNKMPILNCLNSGVIPVVTGFQGLTSEQEITTLGRGGSDTTAIALASALKADRCDIYTDVDGIYTADPRVAVSARKLATVSYEQMLDLATNGAQVLNATSAEMAKKMNVPLRVRSTFRADDEGTLITDLSSYGDAVGLAACSNLRLLKITLGGNSNSRHKRLTQKIELAKFLRQFGVEVEVVTPLKVNESEFALLVKEDDAKLAETTLSWKLSSRDSLTSLAGMAKLSVICDSVSSDLQTASLMCLSHSGVKVSATSTSEHCYSLVIPKESVAHATGILHDRLQPMRRAA